MRCSNIRKIFFAFLEAFSIMVIFQVIIGLLKYLATPFFPDTIFSSKMITMCIMTVLTFVIIGYAKLEERLFRFSLMNLQNGMWLQAVLQLCYLYLLRQIIRKAFRLL